MRQMHPATQMRSPRQPSSQRRCRRTLSVQLPNQNFLNYVFSSQLLSFCFLLLASQLNGSTRSHVSHISKKNLSPLEMTEFRICTLRVVPVLRFSCSLHGSSFN